MATDLNREVKYFRSHRTEWVEAGHEGKWVVLRIRCKTTGETSVVELVGFFTSLEAAYDQGVDHFGEEPFLVKRVTATEQVETIHRGI